MTLDLKILPKHNLTIISKHTLSSGIAMPVPHVVNIGMTSSIAEIYLSPRMFVSVKAVSIHQQDG